jgi:prepilin-type N-terminal cleavage/methylation domain-containing protein
MIMVVKFKKNRGKNILCSGMTLVEIVVVMAISAIVIMLIVRAISTGLPVSKITFLQARSTETARLQLKRIAKALREARESDMGSYPLDEVTSQRIVFYSDIDSDMATERIRYELVGNNLERGVIKPTGDPISYEEIDEEVSVVASSIRNNSEEAVFRYYTGDYPDDSDMLSPTDLTEVKYIEFSLIIDADPMHDPGPINLVSQVQLRNLKTNLGEVVEE